jgi:hypothetical protein
MEVSDQLHVRVSLLFLWEPLGRASVSVWTLWHREKLLCLESNPRRLARISSLYRVSYCDYYYLIVIIIMMIIIIIIIQFSYGYLRANLIAQRSVTKFPRVKKWNKTQKQDSLYHMNNSNINFINANRSYYWDMRKVNYIYVHWTQ